MNVRAALADRRVRLAALGLVLALAVLLVVVIAGGGKSTASAPPNEAARLVPADALVYVHLSTDTKREGTARALELAERFPGFERLRNSLLRQLNDPRCGTNLSKLKGREAALALLPGNTGTAGSLVLVDSGKDHPKAQTKACGLVSQTYIGRFLAIGQLDSLRAARQLSVAGEKAVSLAGNPDYAKATAKLPADRVADAWASRDGVRRLLAPQGGVLGAAGVLLDQPALKGAAAALVARKDGARIVVRSRLDPKLRTSKTFSTFAPTLQATAPGNALAYIGVGGLQTALGRILTAAGPGTAGLNTLLRQFGKQLDKQSGGRLTQQVLSVLRGQVGISLQPALPAPVLTIVAGAKPGTESALAELEKPIAKLLGPKAKFERAALGGREAHVLKGGALGLAYAVFDGHLLVSTAPSGITAAARKGGHLADTKAFKQVTGDAPARVTSLLFLDFTALLRLGEQTGLSDSQTYQAVRDDLQKVRAVGAWSSGAGDESTAEINLSIP